MSSRILAIGRIYNKTKTIEQAGLQEQKQNYYTDDNSKYFLEVRNGVITKRLL